MRKITLVLLLLSYCSYAFARDAARDLRRMVGYSIIAADTVDKVMDGKMGEKYVRLSSGTVFKVDMLLLDPLPMTDVIVFAKAPTKEILDQFKGKVPEIALYQIKILIDNEAFDAPPLK